MAPNRLGGLGQRCGLLARPIRPNALVNLRLNDYGRPLREIRDSFWNNPHKPLLPKGDAELADAIHQAVNAGDVVLVDDTGDPYTIHNPGDVNLADPGVRLQRPAPPQDSPDPDHGEPPEPPPVAPDSDGGEQPAPAPPAPPQPDPAPASKHWLATITINTNIDTAKGDDPLVQLLRELMVAVDDGHIAHINQMSTVTITADQKTADKLQAAAD